MALTQKRRRPEHVFQVRLVKWLTENAYPDSVWFAVANGELRHINVALRLKAEGVRSGVPDLCFLLRHGRTGWLELKVKGGSLSDAQRGFATKAKKLGHLWAPVKTLNDAAIVLKHWGVIKPNAPLPEE
jgi:VRR-NUC domain